MRVRNIVFGILVWRALRWEVYALGQFIRALIWLAFALLRATIFIAIIVLAAIIDIVLLLAMLVLNLAGRHAGRRPPIDPTLREQVFRKAQDPSGRPRWACHHCGQTSDSQIIGPDGYGWHVDHLIPFIHGGPTTLANLVLACRTCNLHKGAKVA